MTARKLLHKINSRFEETREIWVLMPSKDGLNWLCVLSVHAGSAESFGEAYSGTTQLQAVKALYEDLSNLT